jgi:DNA repair protein SbcC/Rad50
MIPTKLKMRNFMCYKDNVPELSFEGMHIACLCGDNGHGKSAIFDAITWALWGQSRAKSDDDLIYIGQKETEVDLEFTIQSQRYRVIRKRIKRTSATRPGQSSLELQILDNGAFKSITGNTLTETEKKITELLHLDYDTFINSVFLRQGNSDEFSTKKPAERKEVLGSILGLSDYEKYEDKARALIQQNKNMMESLELTNQNSMLQIARKDELLQDIEKCSGELNEVMLNRESMEQKLSGLRQQKQEWELKKDQLLNVESRLRELQTDLVKWQTKKEETEKRITEYSTLIASRDDIEKGYSGLVDARKNDNELNLKLNRIIKLNEQKSRLETVLNREENKLRIEYEKLKESVKLKKVKHEKIDSLKADLIEINKNLKRVEGIEEEAGNKNSRLKELYEAISYLKSRQKHYEADIQDLEEKIKMLGTDKSRCPLCNSELGVKELGDLKINLQKELGDKKKSKADDGNEMLARIKESSALENELRTAEADTKRERTIWQNKLAVRQRELEDAELVGKELEADEEKLTSMEQALNNKTFLLDDQNELKNINAELAVINYDNVVHEQLKQEIARLSVYEKKREELNKADSLLNVEAKSLKDTDGWLDDNQKSIESNNEKSRLLAADIEKLKVAISGLDQIEAEYKLVQQKEAGLRDNLAANQERLKYISELEKSIKDNENQLAALKREDNIYKELSEAFSKKGLQALLIKQAFPEIEIEANRLLNRMTDNRLSLTLESQKEMKSRKGEVIETLDIKISDELGTRNYEMFSGGESFRIDLALRIALSKLLVRRAGASMPILIIDEGFGTQDITGRERLVEAIKSIEDDFEKIFVITHLEELKEYFPVIISVRKSVEGSTISVN